MTKEELKIWLSNKIDLCYHVAHNSIEDCVFLYYDEQSIRKNKLSKLINKDYKQSEIKGVCLFHIDNNSYNLYFDCDLSIWSVIEKNSSDDYNKARELISNVINSHKYENLHHGNILIPYAEQISKFNILSNINNLHIL